MWERLRELKVKMQRKLESKMIINKITYIKPWPLWR